MLQRHSEITVQELLKRADFHMAAIARDFATLTVTGRAVEGHPEDHFQARLDVLRCAITGAWEAVDKARKIAAGEVLPDA